MNGYHPDHDTPDTAASTAGTSLKVLKLWQHHLPDGRVRWLTTPPQIDDDPSEAESPEYAITLRHRSVGEHSNKQRPQLLDSIIIRAPSLRTLLAATIPNISASYDEAEQGIVMQAPFRHLFWHLDAIELAAAGSSKDTSTSASSSSSSEGELQRAASLLLTALSPEFRPLLARQRTMLAQGEINFDTLWTLYRPGMTCITMFNGDKPIAVECVAIDYGRHAMGGMYYRIHYRNLVWNGDGLGWREGYVDILEFRGRRRLGAGTLAVVPLEVWEGEGGRVGELAARGRRFVDLVSREPYMVRFSGESLDAEASPMMWWQGEMRKKMSERVVLDAKAYNHYFRRLSQSMWRAKDRLGDLRDEELVYCFPELHAFALKQKRWTRLWIDDVEEVVFNDRAYPSLVLPSDYKQLLLAFAEAHMEGYGDGGGFDDVIAGKGQGILMLLAGPPGTGKTLTAEAMAEHMRRPLYSVSTGELGVGNNMEHELNKVLELSTRWNAVLLLDEADVFLERRADNDLVRNSVVSVFLRRLEYYRGVMFLTTNRIGSFDEAFRSRIHVAIQYPDLDEAARRRIWEGFLEQARETYKYGVEVGEGELAALARDKVVNGREIRNLVKSAQLLASRGREKLGRRHVEIVWRVEMENSPWKAAGVGRS